MNVEVDSEHSNPSLRSRERASVVSTRPQSQSYAPPDDGEVQAVWSPGSTRRFAAPDRNCRMRSDPRGNTRLEESVTTVVIPVDRTVLSEIEKTEAFEKIMKIRCFLKETSNFELISVKSRPLLPLSTTLKV